MKLAIYRWWFMRRRHQCNLPVTTRWTGWSCDYCGAAYQALYIPEEPHTYERGARIWVAVAGPTKIPERKDPSERLRQADTFRS